jgi:hypothetical protein
MHRNFSRLGAALFVTLIAVGIGALAYQAGVSHGLALQIPAGTAAAPLPPYAYYYGWYRPWGFGLFGPFFFVLFWLFVVRAIFWGGRRRWYGRGWHDGPYGFEEWHRRAHERMSNPPPTPTNL